MWREAYRTSWWPEDLPFQSPNLNPNLDVWKLDVVLSACQLYVIVAGMGVKVGGEEDVGDCENVKQRYDAKRQSIEYTTLTKRAHNSTREPGSRFGV